MGHGTVLYTVSGGSKLRDALPFEHMVFIDALDPDIQPTHGDTHGRYL